MISFLTIPTRRGRNAQGDSRSLLRSNPPRANRRGRAHSHTLAGAARTRPATHNVNPLTLAQARTDPKFV